MFALHISEVLADQRFFSIQFLYWIIIVYNGTSSTADLNPSIHLRNNKIFPLKVGTCKQETNFTSPHLENLYET